ncbi:MAG: hypothetical protein K0A89_00925 [ANME-2 cluster archaeon]|nr:hypothetical protein [ANME-2 cluster archaeon]
MKNSHNMPKKYFIFFGIGILAFLIGEFSQGFINNFSAVGIHGTGEMLLIVLIYAILFVTGLFISKEWSLTFALKAFSISFITLMLVFSGFFMWGAYSHYNAKYIDAHKLQTAPDEFVVLTEEEMEEYPELKDAIISQRVIKVKPDKWNEIRGFLGEKASYNVKVYGEYYRIGFILA